MKHELMYNNFTKDDFKEVKKLLNKKNPVLTQSKKVEEFENKWSKWLGVKYSTYVNSGSSANYISISILKALQKKNKKNKKNEIIVPSLTWVSDVNSIIMNDFKPVFVDINLNNLSMNLEQVKKKINKKTLAIFITHAQGFNGLDEDLLKIINQRNRYMLNFIP